MIIYYIGKSALSNLVNEIKKLVNTKAATDHKHSTSDITSGTLNIARGGTGGTSSAIARINLGATNIELNPSEPTNQNTGDIWLKEIK